MVGSSVCALMPDMGHDLPRRGAQVPPRVLLTAAAASMLLLEVSVSTSALCSVAGLFADQLWPWGSGTSTEPLEGAEPHSMPPVRGWSWAWCFELGHL